MEKKPPSTEELNKMIKDLQPGETKHFPEYDMTIHRPVRDLPTRFDEAYEPKQKAKVIKSKDIK